MLPLAQRLVTLEVQDEYRHLLAKRNNGKPNNKATTSSSNSNSIIDQTWDALFESRHQTLKQEKERELEVEAEAQRLFEEKQQKRQQRRQQRGKPKSPSDSKSQQLKEIFEQGDERVNLLETYIRPALQAGGYTRHLFTHHNNSNNEQSSNSGNSYDTFVKWIRGEYLIAKYGLQVQTAIRDHPELRDDAAGLSTVEVETTSDGAPLVLPTVAMVRDAFDMKDWSKVKVPYSSWGEEEEDKINNTVSGSVSGDNVDGQQQQVVVAKTELLSIEQIIHNKLHGQIAHSGPLNAYFEMRRREDSYELWTKDYIYGLAQYLLDRIAEIDNNEQQQQQQQDGEEAETIILDVGAGDGRLVYFLRRAMQDITLQRSKSSKTGILSKASSSTTPSSSSQQETIQKSTTLPIIIATDDGSWKAPMYTNSQIQVEQLSVLDALDKYCEEGVATSKKTRLIVLCSWMPPGVDWTADFRRRNPEGVPSSVEEYIICGEADDGSCGHNWYTWGNPDFDPEGNECESKQAPYSVDGYTRVDLVELSLLQLSRFDCKRSSESQTVSFRRA